MPPDFDDEDLIDEVLDDETRKTYAPPKRQKIQWYTVGFLMLNRTIGSGIFATSASVLQNTQSPGVSLILWSIGGLLTLCVSLVWLEFGLSIPRERVVREEYQYVPRSGGEKNYLEFSLKRPKFLATCMYGIPFILLGNLAGNAVAFGRYVMLAAGHHDADGNITANKGSVIGIAIAASTFVVLVHIGSRRGGIAFNDLFAIYKVLLLLAVIIIGFIYRGNGLPQKSLIGGQNFSSRISFGDRTKTFSDYTWSLLLVVYSFSGYEQPFYVLSEVYRPKRAFAKTVIATVLVTIALYLLVNIAYLCVVPMDTIYKTASPDMVTLFFDAAFSSPKVTSAMQALVAIAILGNMIVMTFTASRVKQELAKEGILPWSLFFATSHVTPISWFRSHWQTEHKKTELEPHEDSSNPLEQSPMAALGLQWLSSVFLIAVTAGISSINTQFNILVLLYSYTMVVLISFCTTTGLLYCKYIRRDWVGDFKPWGGPTAAIIYWIAALFILITAFLKPSTVSTYPHYIVPIIGLSALLWGVIWWLFLKVRMSWTGFRLVVTRTPFIQQQEENGEWVMRYEVIKHRWTADDVNSERDFTT